MIKISSQNLAATRRGYRRPRAGAGRCTPNCYRESFERRFPGI